MDIDKLLLKVMNNKASTAEYEALEAWKNDSEDNIALLQQIMTGQAEGKSTYKQYNKEKAWKTIDAQLDPAISLTPKQKPRKGWLAILAMIIISIAAFFYLSNKNEKLNQYDSANEMLAFALEDDSKIWLREGGSTLNVLSDFQKERKVALTGEAFFDISPDKNKPFIINLANEDYIRVVGTSFNVINTEDQLDIIVYSGTVEFHALNRVLTLQKNDRVTREQGAIVKRKNNNQHKLSWKNKELIFDNIDLSRALDAISDHYKVDFTLDNSTTNLANCTIRTKFNNEPIESVLKELSNHFGFNYSLSDNNIIISDLSCN